MTAQPPSPRESRIDERTLRSLSAALSGPVIAPGHAEYDDARKVWNGMIDRTPALIVRCAGVPDIIESVRFAREHGLVVAVRGGGHSVAGHGTCDGGLVVDLSPMKGIAVDPAGRSVRAEPGLRWGEFDRTTQAHGLAVTGGLISDTGIAGLTLGGGIGWLMRKHGLTSDNLLSTDLVTADGDTLTVDPEREAELFWGLQRGGGNFGIVSSFRYRLHEVGPIVLAGMVLHRMERAAELLRFYREFTDGAPKELTSLVILRRLPALASLPPFLHGAPVIGIAVCWAGNHEEGERVLAPLRGFGPPLSDGISLKPYVKHQTLFDAAQAPGRHNWWKSENFPALSDGLADALVDGGANLSSGLSVIALYQMGGEARLGDAAFVLNIQSTWTDPAESDGHVEWTRSLWRAVRPFATGATYVNFLGNEPADRVQSAYRSDYDRLVALKNRYDPSNFFRLNQNIRPTVGA
jgi:FAD/FMN-containing dehydrogenase